MIIIKEYKGIVSKYANKDFPLPVRARMDLDEFVSMTDKNVSIHANNYIPLLVWVKMDFDEIVSIVSTFSNLFYNTPYINLSRKYRRILNIYRKIDITLKICTFSFLC